MKLSQYAKKMGVTRHTAWTWFKAKLIPGAYQLPSGTIVVPDDIEEVHKQEFLKKHDTDIQNKA